MDALLNRKPVEDISHVRRDVTKLRDTANQTGGCSQDSLKRMQTDLWETDVKRGTIVQSVKNEGMYQGGSRGGRQRASDHP